MWRHLKQISISNIGQVLNDGSSYGNCNKLRQCAQWHHPHLMFMIQDDHLFFSSNKYLSFFIRFLQVVLPAILHKMLILAPILYQQNILSEKMLKVNILLKAIKNVWNTYFNVLVITFKKDIYKVFKGINCTSKRSKSKTLNF